MGYRGFSMYFHGGKTCLSEKFIGSLTSAEKNWSMQFCLTTCVPLMQSTSKEKKRKTVYSQTAYCVVSTDYAKQIQKIFYLFSKLKTKYTVII